VSAMAGHPANLAEGTPQPHGPKQKSCLGQATPGPPCRRDRREWQSPRPALAPEFSGTLLASSVQGQFPDVTFPHLHRKPHKPEPGRDLPGPHLAKPGLLASTP
jgi:hypothetical protein